MKSARKFTFVGLLIILLGCGLIAAGVIRSRVGQRQGSAGSEAAQNKDISVVADGLQVPWGLAVLPDNELLVTERPGTLTHLSPGRQHYQVKGVAPTAEGGLLGLALDPRFSENHQIYMYMTTKDGDTLTNQIERYTYADDQLSNRQVIFGGIPGSNVHDGGRLAFGPDGYLYATTGDANNQESAQDKTSLSGKILRLTTDGQPAPGNPFGTAIYSYGHRNPQGLAWDEKGQLWETEHGRSVTASGYDELNLIRAGANYGWPVIQGDDAQAGMVSPVAQSGPDTTWAPSGMAYADGSLFFGGLRGQALFEAKVQPDNSVKLRKHYTKQYGRLRTVISSGDYLYVTTSNTDGRGTPKQGDDKILKIRVSSIKD
jgi:glucose/arabinose dehydrogenase